MRRFLVSAAVLAAVSAMVMPAAASDFCGGNGVVKLSFVEGPDLQPVVVADPDSMGLTVVQVWAVLDEVEGPGGVFLALGGFELELRITGAEPVFVEKACLFPHRDIGQRPTQLWVGASEGAPIEDGRVSLCRWKVGFAGEPRDVRFDLDPAGLISCDRVDGCPGSGASALYVGWLDSRQEGFIFSAGCAPAVLNAVGEPDLAPIPTKVGYADIGVFTARETVR